MTNANITCSLSGVVPQKPVISPQGYIFESSIIEPYLERHGNRCPITKEDLLVSSLKKIKFTAPQIQAAPKPSSISNLIGVLQNDFDASMAETFELRKENEELRKELSANLYTEDAAIRLLASLQRRGESLEQEVQILKERAVEVIAAGGPVADAGAGNTSSSALPTSIPASVEEDLSQLEAEFQTQRKETKDARKTAAANVFAPEKLVKFKCGGGNSIPMHSTTTPGIRCMVLSEMDENCVVTGGKDGAVIVFDKLNKRLISTLKTSMRDPKPVSSLAMNNELIVAGSVDGSIHLFEMTGDTWRKGYAKSKSLKPHSKAVTGCTFHSSGKYFITCSSDKSYTMYYTDGTPIYQYKKNDEYTAIAIHPGGTHVALGCASGTVCLGSFNDSSHIHNVVPIGRQAVTSLDFHENCTILAAGTKDGTVKVYNLKKEQEVKVLTFPDLSVLSVKFDAQGKYLGISLSDGALYVYEMVKNDYKHVVSYPAHKDACTAFAFGRDCKYLTSVGMDRQLNIWE